MGTKHPIRPIQNAGFSHFLRFSHGDLKIVFGYGHEWTFGFPKNSGQIIRVILILGFENRYLKFYWVLYYPKFRVPKNSSSGIGYFRPNYYVNFLKTPTPYQLSTKS